MLQREKLVLTDDRELSQLSLQAFVVTVVVGNEPQPSLVVEQSSLHLLPLPNSTNPPTPTNGDQHSRSQLRFT